jgi:hypothetical protein
LIGVPLVLTDCSGGVRHTCRSASRPARPASNAMPNG